MPRYSAKLLFIWDPDPVTDSRVRRLCEERIVVFRSRSARDAVRKAKALGRAAQLHFDSGHRLRFAGVLQCMDVDWLDPGEVWWEFQRRTRPEHWARKAVPPQSRLYVFKDKEAHNRGAGQQAHAPDSRGVGKRKRPACR